MINRIDIGANRLDGNKALLQSVNNLSFPDINYSVVKKGGFIGSTVALGKSGGYKFTTEWVLTGTSFSDLVTQRDTFLGYLAEVLKTSQTLKLYRSNGVNLQIDVVGLKVLGNVEAQSGTTSNLLVEFQTEYPYLSSQTLHSQEVDIYNGGGISIPMALPLNFTIGETNAVTVNNAGNTDSYPTYTFYGIMQNPTLTNATTGEQLSLTFNLTSATDFITVDTFNRTVTKTISGIAANARRYATGEFPYLKAGNNTIQLTAASDSTGAKVMVSWRDSFLNI